MGTNTFRHTPIYGPKGVYSYGMPVMPGMGAESMVWNRYGLNLFVDGTNGSDNADGKSWDRALATLSQANTLLASYVKTSGDPVYIWIAPATYTMTAAIAVTYPNVHWRGMGYDSPYGSGIVITQFAETGVWEISATGDNGSIAGCFVNADVTGTPADVIAVAANGDNYKVFNNVFKTSDSSKANTIIDGDASYLTVINNKFIDCKIGVDAAAAYPYICNNLFSDASTESGTRGVALTNTAADSGEIAYNIFAKSGASANNIMLSVITGAGKNVIHHNLFDAAASAKPIVDADFGSLTNLYFENYESGGVSASSNYTEATHNVAADFNAVIPATS